MINAFLFDLEGVLFNTYPVYLKILLQTLLTIKKEYNLSAPLPTAIELAQLIGDKPYHEAQKILLAHYPVFQPFQLRIMELFKPNLIDEFNNSTELLIKNSVQALNLLLANKQKIAIVTNCPYELAKLLLSTIDICVDHKNQLRNSRFVFLVTPELCGGKGKPNSEMYLKAANLLHVEPFNCLVFEDSLRGIKAAYDANMQIVILNNPYQTEDLPIYYRKIERVNKLTDSSFLKKYVTTKSLEYSYSDHTYTDIYFISQLEDIEKENLAKEIYSVYRNLFVGRDYLQWKSLFFDPELKDAILYLMKDASNQAIGFFLISIFELNFEEQFRVLLKLYMGVLPKHNNSGITIKAYHHAGRYLKEKYKGVKIHIFENIAGPVAYAKACHFFGKYLRPSLKTAYSKNERAYLNFLISKFHYKSISPDNDYLIQSQSCVFIEPILFDKLKKSTNRDIQFFIEQTHLKPGVGLACLVDAIPGFLDHLS